MPTLRAPLNRLLKRMNLKGTTKAYPKSRQNSSMTMKSTSKTHVYNVDDSVLGTTVYASFGDMSNTKRENVIMVNESISWVSRSVLENDD